MRARMTMRREGSDRPLPLRAQLTIEAEVIDGGEKARVTLDNPSVPGGIPGPDIELVIWSNSTYFRPLAEPETLPKGKEWFLLSPSRVRRLGFGQFLDFVAGGSFLTPEDYTSDEDIGTEEIGGVETKIYEFREDLEEMAEVVPISEARLEKMRKLVGDALYLKIWVDGNGFTRRMDMPVQIPDRFGVEGAVVSRFEFFDFNADIDFPLPDLSKIVIP